MVYHPFREWWLKVLALSIAVLLWFAVVGEPVVERGLEIPLNFENVPVGLRIADDSPHTVSVRVRGPSGVVNRLDEESVVAVLDLGDENPGRRMFDMFAGRVEVPSGLEVTSVIPATVVLTLERYGTSRKVTVVPNVEGQPADGMIVGGIAVDPASVDVIGPEKSLAEIREAVTETVSIAGATSDVEVEVTVGIVDPTLRLVEPVRARVSVDIIPRPVE